MKKWRVKIYSLIFIILISLILIIDIVLHNGIFTAHDIETNLIYFGAFYQSLIDGNIVPRWAGNIANLYGSPTIMFFYPLSYYLAVPLHYIGLNLAMSMKIFILISFIASAVFFYLWLKNHIGNLASMLGALLYVYAPYRINDIYARGSVAENTFFALFPLLLLALYRLKIRQNLRNGAFLSIILAMSILAHPFMLVIFSPILLFYLIYLRVNFLQIKYFAFGMLFSLLLTSFYSWPLLFENKYTHYDISPFNGSEYQDQFVSVEKLVMPVWNFIDRKGKWEYQTYQIGVVQLGLFICSIVYIYHLIRRKKYGLKKDGLGTIGLAGFVISIFMMLPASNFLYKYIIFLQRVEFPWRFMALNLFSLAVLVSVLLDKMKIERQKWIILLISICSILLYLPYSRGHDYKIVPDDYYLYQIRENTDAYATLPKWAAAPDLYPRIADRYKILSGEAESTVLSRSSSKHIYSINAYTDTYFADMTFYFPGWNVYIDGGKSEIQFQNPDYRGIITFNIPRGEHLIEVVFFPTKVRMTADLVSFLSFIILLILFYYDKNKKIPQIDS